MAMQIGPTGGDGEDEILSSINTTPLVDVMLVLLIIFLITIPVVTQTIPVALPREVNQPTQTRPENITVAVDKDGGIYWNTTRVAGTAALFALMKTVAAQEPQPEVHVRGDQQTRYEFIGKIMATCQRAGIAKVSFITEPAPKG